MTFALTPVLTANWGTPRSWTLAAYRRTGGYDALRAALAMEPDALIFDGQRVRAPGSWRRRLPDRHEVGLYPAG